MKPNKKRIKPLTETFTPQEIRRLVKNAEIVAREQRLEFAAQRKKDKGS